MSLRELNSLAPWRWDRSKKPVGDASLRDFAEVNRIIPSLMKGNIDAAKAAEELAAHVPGKRRTSMKEDLAPSSTPCRQQRPSGSGKETPFIKFSKHQRYHPQSPNEDPILVPTPGASATRCPPGASATPRSSGPPPTPLAALARHSCGAAHEAVCQGTPVVPTPAGRGPTTHPVGQSTTPLTAVTPASRRPVGSSARAWHSEREEQHSTESTRAGSSPCAAPAAAASAAVAAVLAAQRLSGGGGGGSPSKRSGGSPSSSSAGCSVVATPGQGLLPAKLRAKAAKAAATAAPAPPAWLDAEPMLRLCSEDSQHAGPEAAAADDAAAPRATLQDLLAAAAAAGASSPAVGRKAPAAGEEGTHGGLECEEKQIVQTHMPEEVLIMLASAAKARAGSQQQCHQQANASGLGQQQCHQERHPSRQGLAAAGSCSLDRNDRQHDAPLRTTQQQQHGAGTTPARGGKPASGAARRQHVTVRLSPLTGINVVATGSKQQSAPAAAHHGQQQLQQQRLHGTCPAGGPPSDAPAPGAAPPSRRMHPGQAQHQLQHRRQMLLSTAPAPGAFAGPAALLPALQLPAVMSPDSSSCGPSPTDTAQAPPPPPSSRPALQERTTPQRKQHHAQHPRPLLGAQQQGKQHFERPRSRTTSAFNRVPYNPALVPGLFKKPAPPLQPPPPPPRQQQYQQQQYQQQYQQHQQYQQQRSQQQLAHPPTPGPPGTAPLFAASARLPPALPIAPLSVPGPISHQQCWGIALANPWVIGMEAQRAGAAILSAKAAAQGVATKAALGVATGAKRQLPDDAHSRWGKKVHFA